MSDLMFDEVPVSEDKKFYKFGDWKEYARHNEREISGFFGDYRWLSNFHPCPVYFDGLLYPSSENAYQAAKLATDYRHHLQICSVKSSKKDWKKYPLLDNAPEEWNERRYDVMSVILFDKFYRNKELRQKLLDTGDRFLEESNHWKDSYWGRDIKIGGENKLGLLLMSIRSFWQK